MIDRRLTEENMEKQGTLFPSDSILTQRFRIIRLLGAGGMGNVYLAEDLQLSRFVAIKTIRPDLSANEEVKKRIAHECRMHAAIGMHANIVALYDRMEENGNVYLIMEYVEGVLLSELLSSQNTSLASLKVDDVLGVILQILEGLSAIHQKEIVHRDIKPSNVIINNLHSGRLYLKLMDFGIARAEIEDLGLTRLTTLDTNGPGTPHYMAPERIDPKLFGNLCAATDLYSVGVILFQMLSDGPPFRGTMTEIFIGHLTRPPDLTLLRADIHPRLKVILEKALQKKSTERYHNANHFIHDIKQVTEPTNSSLSDKVNIEKTLLASDLQLKGCTIEATCVDTTKVNIHLQKKNRRNKILSVIGALSILLVVGFFIFQIVIDKISKEKISTDNKENSVQRKVTEQPSENVEQKSQEIETKKIERQQAPQLEEAVEQNVNKADQALTAFELAKKKQPIEAAVAVESVGGMEQRKASVNINSALSNSSTQKNKGTGGNSKCQTLLKNFKLGDSSTMQQYRKECAN
ncbi:MAG TPA: hypothetical protein DCG34_05800 [Clostridiales bacterium]|jgi:serine/threonine protein kinase|nr:hypothetical protein [Clostridiales bacterium]